MVQLSQLYRRGVVRPLDDYAAKELETFRIDSPIRVEWLPILSDGDFEEIWESGVFNRINEVCGIEISDYEEVELPTAMIEDSLRALKQINSTSLFLKNLKAMLAEAKESNKTYSSFSKIPLDIVIEKVC